MCPEQKILYVAQEGVWNVITERFRELHYIMNHLVHHNMPKTVYSKPKRMQLHVDILGLSRDLYFWYRSPRATPLHISILWSYRPGLGANNAILG